LSSRKAAFRLTGLRGPKQPRRYDIVTDSRSTENAALGGTGAADCSIPLRDWFAAQALHAAVADYTLACRSGNAHGKPVLPQFSETDNGQAAAVARTAYALADAMMHVRESNAEHHARHGAKRSDVA